MCIEIPKEVEGIDRLVGFKIMERSKPIVVSDVIRETFIPVFYVGRSSDKRKFSLNGEYEARHHIHGFHAFSSLGN